MPISISFDHLQKLVSVVFEETISEEEVLDHVQQMKALPEDLAEYNKVIDLRKGRIIIPRSRQKHICKQTADLGIPKDGRIAIISSNQQEIVHCILFAHDIGNSHRMRLFSTSHGAYEWLGKDLENALE